MQFLGAALGALAFTGGHRGRAAAAGGPGRCWPWRAGRCGTLAPFTLFALRSEPVSAEVAGAFLNLEPLVGAIAGVVVFGDPVGAGRAGGWPS